MDQLLTARQVQDLLKVDRTTIYRMLNDGRLAGVKVGHQWRFSRHEVESLLSSPHRQEPDSTTSAPYQTLPLHCVQIIQDVFAEVAQVGAVTAGPDGQPLTEFSNSSRFCDMVMGSAEGQRRCIAAWRRVAGQQERAPRFATCHAGLQYARGRIEVDGEFAAMVIAGQYYTEEPDRAEEEARIRRVAEECGLDPGELADAAREITVLDERKRAQIGKWLESVAHTFEEVGRERSELMSRLRRIAVMSTLEV